jgi:hypothetical protein
VKIGKSASETSALLTYGEYAMNKWSVFEWHRRFKEGQEVMHDKPRPHFRVSSIKQMENHQCYLEVMTRLWESVWRKRLKLWPDKWIHHHDNALAHDALRVCKFLARKSIKKWPQFLAFSKLN